jgi:hypothetical protein
MVFKKAVKEWMILNQFGRRNLSNYQRSVLALELEEVFTKKAKENQIRKPNSVMQNSAEQEKADEETKAKLRTGEISINQVYTDIKKQEKKEEQRNKVLSEINKRYHLVGIVYLL